MRHAVNGSALCTLAIVCLAAVGAQAQSEVGMVAAIRGVLQMERGGSVQPASIGAPLFPGDRLTTGNGDQAKLVFRDDSVVDMASDTQLVLATASTGRPAARREMQLRLSQGKLRALVGETSPAARTRYEIETPTAVVAVRGTEFIVMYDSATEVTGVICLAGELEVSGTLGVIGGKVQLGPRARTEVAKGRFPANPEIVDQARLEQSAAGLELVGTGHRDGLSVGHPAVLGRLVAGEDVPPRSASAPAAMPAAEGLTVNSAQLQESLAQRLSPDVYANTQPLLDFKLTPPDRLSTGGVKVGF